MGTPTWYTRSGEKPLHPLDGRDRSRLVQDSWTTHVRPGRLSRVLAPTHDGSPPTTVFPVVATVVKGSTVDRGSPTRHVAPDSRCTQVRPAPL